MSRSRWRGHAGRSRPRRGTPPTQRHPVHEAQVQEKERLDAAASRSDLRFLLVVGGLSVVVMTALSWVFA